MTEVYTSPEQIVRLFVYVMIGIAASGVGVVIYDIINGIRRRRND